MAMFLVRLAFGYALAAAAATIVALAQMPIMFGGEPLGWKDSLGAYVVIAMFAWTGVPFAIMGARRGWKEPLTYIGGGLLAATAGVASLFVLSFLQREISGLSVLDGKFLLSAVYNAAQLLALGFLPGVAGGLTYWLVAVRNRRVIA
jgi:hypothetical protein